MAIGDRIKELRLRKGQTLQQVADAVSASKAHVWELENNTSRNPSLTLVRNLAAHFGTTVSYLIDESEGETSRAEQFFRKNKEKLEELDDQKLNVYESLLDIIVKKDGGDGTST
jgi:transcriptional regulator with XRE-family HTH domain